jgi:hypothetical protein
VEGANSFKLECPISAILNISLEPSTEVSGKGVVTVELFQAPTFYMEVKASSSSSWTQCRDFTEGHQASTQMKHILTGNMRCLATELMTAMSNDNYLSRVCQVNDPSAPIISPAITMPQTMFNKNLSFDETRRGSAPASFWGRRGSLLDGGLLNDSPVVSPLTNPLSLDMSPNPLNLNTIYPADSNLSASFGSGLQMNSSFQMSTPSGLDSASSFEFGPLSCGVASAGGPAVDAGMPIFGEENDKSFLTSISEFLA